MLKIAIVGCGKIADSHAQQMRRIPGCEIVGVCDREQLMARQLSDRFGVTKAFGRVDQLLEEAKPDVVHITTPPQSHLEIGRQCLEAGCHIYVEKPFTVDTPEAEELIAVAERKGLKLTVGHDDQFTHVSRRMRELVRAGYLGGTPVHMESTWCYDLGNPTYAKAFLGNEDHWARRLPGRLLHNLISHGVAKIAEFLTSDKPEVTVVGFPSQFLHKLGEYEIVDELRVIISEKQGATAYFTFSSQMRPLLHEFRIFGPGNGLCLDLDAQMLVQLGGRKYKSYLAKFVPPVSLGKQCLTNLAHNLRLFLGRDFHMDAGKKFLIEAFYRSITENGPVPIEYRQILLTSRLMDAFFHQLYGSGVRDRVAKGGSDNYTASPRQEAKQR